MRVAKNDMINKRAFMGMFSGSIIQAGRRTRATSVAAFVAAMYRMKDNLDSQHSFSTVD